ncbi:MAG: molybdenum cofactor guanylyltransferase [Desulfatibacillaceae bacterium]
MDHTERIGVSSAILAGGRNTRMQGCNKAFLEVGGRRLIDRVASALGRVMDEVLIVSNEPRVHLDMGLGVTSDVFSTQSALSGIHAALLAASRPHCMVVPCDLPFLAPGVVRALAAAVSDRWDVVVPRTGKGLEPLCAVYGKRCIRPMERALTGGRLKIRLFYEEVRVLCLDETELRGPDPDLWSFFNVNTPQDLETARRHAAVPMERARP